VCGKSDPDKWTPLSCRTFFSEGWCEPYITPPSGSGGALRQGWVNTFDAFFNRQVVGIYSHSDASRTGRNEDVGSFLFESPISRRWMVGVFVSFVDSLGSTTGSPSATGFGDVIFENRFILTETQDTTLSMNLNVRTPTGDQKVGADQTSIITSLAFWQDLGKGVSVRGGAGLDIPVDNDPARRGATSFFNLALGQTLTRHEAAPLGDFTYYASMNCIHDLGSRDSTLVSITPGIRTYLGKNFWLLAGVEVPLTGAKPYNDRFTFLLVRGF
jgi:hypothetical protein